VKPVAVNASGIVEPVKVPSPSKPASHVQDNRLPLNSKQVNCTDCDCLLAPHVMCRWL